MKTKERVRCADINREYWRRVALTFRSEGVKKSLTVILSAAKDLRSFLWLNDLRTTAAILRCALQKVGA